MRGFTRLIVGMLVITWMGSAVHAQVVLNMPPPKSTPARTVVDSAPQSVDATSAKAQAQGQPSDSVRVGDVALARYRRARTLPRAAYGYGGRFWRPYGYNYGYSYGYGYYPFHIGFGHLTFGHRSHHHHGMGKGSD